jgi:hypothetical protein
MINADMNFYGVTINVDIKVTEVTYQCDNPKDWRYRAVAYKESATLPCNFIGDFNYQEGKDPLKLAYDHLSKNEKLKNAKEI